MRVLKSFIISISIYSKIPMPQFAWKDEDMRYTLCFFPFVGVIIGLLLYGWQKLCGYYELGTITATFIGAAFPLLITGGFHVDGYLDTMDAFHSYQAKEKKLEILKDPHIGAFAVIMFGLYGLLYVGAMAQVIGSAYLYMPCFSFFFARVLSGLGVVSFPSAKAEGLLYTFASTSHRRVVKGTLYTELVLGIAVFLYVTRISGVIALLSGGVTYWYYYWKTKKELGGITGDTAGYFVTLFELVFMIVAAVCQIGRL